MSGGHDIARKFSFSDTVAYPLKVAFPVFRNDFTKLYQYFSNVKKIVELERKEVPNGAEVTLQWFLNAKLPGLAAKLIPEDKLMWLDKARWYDKEKAVKYCITVPDLSDAVKITGRNVFTEEDGKTKIQLSGEIHTDIDKIKWAPKFVLKSVVPAIEAFGLKMTKPNFIQLNRGVEKYIASQKARK